MTRKRRNSSSSGSEKSYSSGTRRSASPGTSRSHLSRRHPAHSSNSYGFFHFPLFLIEFIYCTNLSHEDLLHVIVPTEILPENLPPVHLLG